MKTLLCAAMLQLLVSAAVAQQNNRAAIHGKLVNFGEITQLQRFDELQYLLPTGNNPVIRPAADNSFSIVIPLDEPGYYRLGRNKLWLSPGDDLEVFIDQGNSELATFSGRGSEANMFLRDAPFPKGGSYLNAGRDIRESAEATLSYIREEGKRRNQRIAALQQVSPGFKKLEYARVKADMIKSIKSFNSYGFHKFSQQLGDSAARELTKHFAQLAEPVIDSLSNDFIHPNYLQIETYRDLVDVLDMKKAKKAADTLQIADWMLAMKVARNDIGRENDKEKIKAMEPLVTTIATPAYRDAVYQLWKEKFSFGDGDLAVDFVARNTDGKDVPLSQLKGKLIYVDLWATWCGPCLAEMPHLEKLKEAYASNSDVAIVSLSIDDTDQVWLNNLKKRKPGGIQWRINRADLGEYNIVSVPRYILIGKDFKIIAMNAPEASNPDIKKIIDKQLSL